MTQTSSTYPGESLGMPEYGSGSMARLGRRVAALAIDYVPVILISVAFFDYDPIAVLAVFACIQIVFIPTIGGSPGHRLLRMRVIRADGAWTGVWRPMIRTLLLVLVIPAVIFDADGRGMHDKAAGTLLIRD